MRTQHIDRTRIDDLEDRLSILEARVQSLEGRATWHRSAEPESEDEAPQLGAATEYWIGAKLLPRLGAVLIILAIAFIAISESSKNASVDRAVLLAFEALLCVGFIAVGEWRRDALEGFGRTLTAIGATGLYLVAAGGHFAYHTLSASGMAALFAFFTILSHAYAVWRNTRLFFIIGATGGLAAMLFPLADKAYGTGLGVYVTVTIAAAVVCATRRWMLLAFFGWLLGLGILAPVIDSPFPRWSVVAALYFGSLACIGAYERSHQSDDYDFAAIATGLMVLVTGIVGCIVIGGTAGILHLLALSALGTTMALFSRKGRPAPRCFLLGSWITPAALIPLCLPLPFTVWAYVGIGAIALAIGSHLGRKLAAAFAVGAFSASILAYGAWSLSNPDFNEHLLLAALAANIAITATSLKLAGRGWISLSIASLWALAARWAIVLSPSVEQGAHSFSMLTSASVLYALVLLVLGFRLKSGKLRMWSVAVMLVSVFQILVLESETAIGFRLFALLFLGGMMLVGGYTYVRDRKWESPTLPSAQP